MRTLTLLFSLIVTFPFVLSAQTAGELLQKVSAALSEGQDDYVVSLFRQAIAAGADQTEMYYWIQIEKNSAITSVSGIMTKLIFFTENSCSTIPKMFLHLCRVPKWR